MSKKAHFRESFHKKHAKRGQALLKSASQNLYDIHRSLPSQLSWKTFLLLTCQILGRLVNRFPTNEKYPVLKRDNLTMPIEMQFSRKQKTFSELLLHFRNLYEILNSLRKKMTLIDFVFPKLRTAKKLSDKCLKSPVWEDPSTSNMVNMPNKFWNLRDIIFMIFIDHCQVNWGRKSMCFWHTKPWESLLTYSLPMESIVLLRETI